MAPKFELRPSDMADLAALARWFPDAEALRFWGGPDLRFPLDEEQFEHMLEEARGNMPRRRCFSFEQEGILAGHVQVIFTPEDGVVRLARVAVAPNLRGQGAGFSFLTSVIPLLFDEGVLRIELNVYPENMAARGLYQRLGFIEEKANSAGQKRSDVIRMSLTATGFTARCRVSI